MTRIYLVVPFSEKMIVKELGGQWDVEKKLWFIEKKNEKLERFELTRLYVPFDEKDIIKEKGAIWNNDMKSWITSSESKHKFEKWLSPPKRNYVNVNYDKRDLVKEAGGKWDVEKKLWFFEKSIPKEFISFK
jgi:hypothetical protein